MANDDDRTTAQDPLVPQSDDNAIDGGDDNASPEPERKSAALVATAVDIHPLVLLSVVDHFNRMNTKAATTRRVVGLLLGNIVPVADGEPRLDITTSFAVPFDEDAKDPSVWFLDTSYAEEMWLMHRKVMPRIKVVGWYSSGPQISANDLRIHLLVAERFCQNPIYCVVNADPSRKGLPVLAYTTTEARGQKNAVEFRNIATELGTLEAEEIGIEQLLRDLTDSTITNLSTKVGDRHLALLRLEAHLGSVEQYLRDVVAGVLPPCSEVLDVLQELVNTLPLVHRLKTASGMLVSTNDAALATFVASVARSVSALYDVIVNRRRLKKDLQLRREEKAKAEKKEEEEAAKKKEDEAKSKDAEADEKKEKKEKK